MTVNANGIWVGPRETLRSPGSDWKTGSIEIAETPRGWEFCTHLMGGGYGIGFHDERRHDSRDEALAAAVDELRRRIERDPPRDRINGSDALPGIVRWLDGLTGAIEQPSLFEEATRAAA